MSSQCLNNLRVTLILLYLIIFSHIEKNALAQKQIICGKELVAALKSFCVNGYNNRIKRCLEGYYEGSKTLPPGEGWYNRLKDVLKKLKSELNESAPDFIETNHPKGEKGDKGLKSFIRKRKHINYVNSKGIADECCIDGCEFAEMTKYCE